VRGGNGPNAGHTVVYNGVQYSLRLIPSGFVNKSTRLLIGPGVPVDPDVLFDEIRKTGVENRIGIDNQCSVLEQHHKEEESRSEHLSKKVGSTKSGVGACNAERALRMVKLARQFPALSVYTTDTVSEIHDALEKDKNVTVEGTQGTFLSLYHGTYPYVTSKDVTASAACADVGIGPTQVSQVIAIFKAYVTRVGEGPLEGQLDRDEVAKRGWTEYGTVTGRERRAAPFDFKLAKRAVQLNGATQIALTKLDVLFPECKGAKDMYRLSAQARSFVDRIQKETSVPVALIGTGPGNADIIDTRREPSPPKLNQAIITKKRA
jgi:adenylosuccinate synthase